MIPTKINCSLGDCPGRILEHKNLPAFCTICLKEGLFGNSLDTNDIIRSKREILNSRSQKILEQREKIRCLTEEVSRQFQQKKQLESQLRELDSSIIEKNSRLKEVEAELASVNLAHLSTEKEARLKDAERLTMLRLHYSVLFNRFSAPQTPKVIRISASYEGDGKFHFSTNNSEWEPALYLFLAKIRVPNGTNESEMIINLKPTMERSSPTIWKAFVDLNNIPTVKNYFYTIYNDVSYPTTEMVVISGPQGTKLW